MKKIAIIGSRSFCDYDLLTAELDSVAPPDIIVSGGAIGADSLAEKFALERKLDTIIFRPDWKKYGKSAGFVRNKKIIEEADIVIAFWDGKSKGTAHSIKLTKSINKPLKVILFGLARKIL